MGWLSRQREQDRTGKSNFSVTANQTKAKTPTTPSRQPSDNESSNRPPVTVAPARTPVNAQESFRVHTFALESSTLGTLLGDAQTGGNGSSRHTAVNPFLGSKRVRDLILECCVPCAMFPLINIGSADDWGTSTASRIHDLLIFLAHALGKSELRKDLITTADVNEAIQLGAKQLCDSPFGFLIPEHFQVSPTEALQLSAAEEFQVFRLCRSRAATATQLYIAQGDVPPPLLKAAARRVSSQYHASGLNLLRNYKGNLVITEIDREIQVLKQLVEEEYSFDPRDTVFWQIRIGKTKLRINFFASEKQSKPSNYEFPLEQLINVVQNDSDDSLKCWLPIKIKLEYKRQGTFHRFHTLARYEGRLPLLNLAFPGSQPRGILALHAVKFITSSYLRDPSTVTKGSNSSNTSTIAIEDCIVLNGKLDPPLSSGLDELLNSVENGTAAPEGTSDVEIVGKSKQQNGSAKRSKWFSTGKSGNSGNSTSRWFTTKASSLSSVDVSSSILHQLATNSQSTTSDSQSDPVLALSKLADIESGKWSNETPSPLIYLDGETNNPSLLYVLLLKFIIKESNPRMSVPEANALQNNLDGFSLELDTRGIAGVSLSENDLGSPLGSDDEIVNGEEYSFGPISQHEGSMLLDEFAVAHGLSPELRDGALLAILAHSCEHALDAATLDSGREPQLPVMLNMIKEQADKVLHVFQQRDVNLLDKFSLGLIATACRYLDSNLIATIARQRHVICTGLHFEDGTFGSLIRALEAVEQLGQVLPDDVRPSAFTPPLIPTLVRVSKAMLAEVEDMYKTMKIRAIRDVGYETRDDPSIVSPNSHESIPSTGSRVIEGTNSAFKCERFSVDLPLPTRSANKVQSDGMNNSSASLASLVEASNPHAIASAAFRKGCVGSMIWGIRLRESTMQGLVEVESIAPASAAAMAVAMSPIQPIAQSASGFSSSPYLRQPKQGDLLIAVAGENVIGWNLERIQRLIQEQVHRGQDGPNSSKPISGLLPDVLEFTFQSPLSTTDRVVLPPPPALMNADGLGSVSPHSGAQRGIAADGILQVDIHQFRGKFKHATIKRATEHALLFKVQAIVGTSSSNTTSPRRCLANVYANDGTGESDQVELIFQDEEPWNVSLSVMNAMRDSVDLKLFSSHKPYFGKRQWYLEAQCGFDLRRLLPNDMGNVTETKWVPSSSDEHCEIRATFRYTNAMQHITTVTSPTKSSKRGRFIKRPGFTSPRLLLTSKRKKKSPNHEIEKIAMQPVEKEDDLPRSVPGRRHSRIHSISITKATTARQTLALAELIKDYLSKELSLFLPTMMMIFPWEKHQASWALVHQETPRAAHLGFPESLHVYTLSSAIVNLLFTQLLADTTLVLQSNPPRFDSLNESLFPLHQTLLDMLQSCSTKHSSDWPILSRAQEESLAGSIANLFKPYVTSWIEATWRSVRDKYVLRIVDSIQEFTNVGSSQSQVLFAFEQDARQLLAKFGRGQRANDLKWIFQETYRVFFSLRFEHDPVTLRRYCKRLIRDPINLFVAKLEEYLLRNIVEREGKLKEHWEHMLLEWNNQISNEANQDDGKSSTKKKWKMPRMGKSKTSTKNASSKTTSPASDVVGNRESEQSASKLYDSEDQMDELVNDVVRVTSVHESGMSLGTLWSADMACFMNDLITLEDAVPGLFKGFQSLCLNNVSAPTPNREDDGQKLLSMHRFMIHVEKIAGGPVHNRDPLFITAKVAHTMDEMESGYYRKLHTRACRQGTTLDEALLFDISCSDPILRLDLVRAFDIKDPSTYKTEVVGFLELPLSAFPVVVDASSGEECNIADQMYEDQWWAFRAVGDDVHGMNLTSTSSQDLPPVVQVTKRSTPRDLNSPIDSPLSLPEIDVQLPNSWGISPGLSRKPARSVASSKPEKENSNPRVVGGSSNTNLPRTGDQVLTVDVATELSTSSSKSKKRFSFPKFSTLRNKSKILSPRGTYSRRFNRKPNPIVDSPNTTSQSVSDDPLTPNNGDDGAMVLPEETFEESTNWDSTKVRLAIQHTRVSLQENSEDILYEAINRVCDVFSNSLCNALRPLVRQACIVSLGKDEGEDLITYSEARASLLGTLDQQLSRFHKCIQLVSTSHPCFRRVLLHTFRGLSVQILEILLPAVNVQRLIGLEGEVNRISSRIRNNVLVETTVSKNSTNNPKRRVGSHRMTRHTSSKLLVNHNRLLQRQDTDNGQVEKQSKKLWKKVLSPKNRNTQRGTKSPKSMSFVDETKSTIETQFGVLPYMDEIAHLVDRLKSYFHADGAGLSDSILQCDPYGPDQLRIVVRNLQDDMTAPSERSDNISVMLRQMGSSGLGLPDPDTRNSVVMLFREWLCCKCIEASLPPQPPASTKSVGDPNTQTGEAKRRRSLLGRRVGKTTNVSLSGSSGTLERLIEDPLAQQSFEELINGDIGEDEEGIVFIHEWISTLIAETL